jgi:hypothetical protein
MSSPSNIKQLRCDRPQTTRSLCASSRASSGPTHSTWAFSTSPLSGFMISILSNATRSLCCCCGGWEESRARVMCGFREWRSVRAAVSVLGPFAGVSVNHRTAGRGTGVLLVLTVSALDAGGDGSSAITPSVKCSLLGLIMIDGSIPGMAGVFWRRTFWNAEIRDRKAGWWPCMFILVRSVSKVREGRDVRGASIGL